jgi:hypothetical protein
MTSRPGIAWRKSSASGEVVAVEVAITADHILIRNSIDPAGPALRFTRSQWVDFLAGVHAGEFEINDPEYGEASAGGVETLVRTDEIVVTIFLSDEPAHERVEAAIEEWLSSSGIEIVHRDDPILGSWFNRQQARAVAHEVAVTAVHGAEARLVLAQDAANTAALGQSVAPIIWSLQTTQEAVVRIGAILIVKFNGAIAVHQLTVEQQHRLNHQPQLARLPGEILSKLELE